MKSLLLAAMSFALSASLLRADLTIVQKIEGLGPATESVVKFKDGKTRMDVTQGPTIIMDPKAGEAITLLHAQKRYMKAPAEVVKAAVDSVKETLPQEAKDQPKLVASGRKETVAGYPAEEYTATVGSEKIALWLTKTVPNYEQVSRDLSAAFRQGPLAVMSQNFGLDLANLPGFPVRQVKELRSGQAVTTTLVSVSSDPIPDTDFEIPAGYEAVSAPELTPRAAVPPGPKPAATP